MAINNPQHWYKRITHEADGVTKLLSATAAILVLIGSIFAIGFILALPGSFAAYDLSSLPILAPMVASAAFVALLFLTYIVIAPAIPIFATVRKPTTTSLNWVVIACFSALAITSALLLAPPAPIERFVPWYKPTPPWLLLMPTASITVLLVSQIPRRWRIDALHACMVAFGCVIWTVSALSCFVVATAMSRDSTGNSDVKVYLISVLLVLISASLSVAVALRNVRIAAVIGAVSLIALCLLDPRYIFSLPFRFTGAAYRQVTFIIPIGDQAALRTLSKTCKPGITVTGDSVRLNTYFVFGKENLINCNDDDSAISIHAKDDWMQVFKGSERPR